MNVSSSPRLLACFIEPSPCCSAPREPHAATSSMRGRRGGELRAMRPTVPPLGERPKVGGGAHSPESRVLAGRRGAVSPRYPDEGAAQRRATRSSVLAVGELRVEAAARTPGPLRLAPWMQRERVLGMRDRPPPPHTHRGAPPTVRLPGVKSLSTGFFVHGLQHSGEMCGVVKERWERGNIEKASWDG
jgi:hypothetical protein